MATQKFNKFSSFFKASTAILALLVTHSFTHGAARTLKLGVIQPMSGGTATFGQETSQGIRMAVEEINKKGELKIEMVLEDDKSDVTDAANAAKKLIGIDKVHAIIGSVPSSNTNAAAPIAEAAKVPLMTSASTNVSITQKGRYISRTCFLDDFQGLSMAKFAFQDLKAKKAAIVIDSTSDYSRGLADAFRTSFKNLGGEIVVEVSYSQKDQNFSSQLTKIRTRKPDVVFAPGYYTEIGNMLRQAKTLGVRSKFLGGDGWSSPKLYEIAGDAVVGHYYADHFFYQDTDPKVQEFVKRYKAKWNIEPSSMSALGYDAVYVMAEAALRVKGPIGSTPLMEEINRTKGFVGVTGSITLDANRNATKPLVVLEGRNGGPGFFKRVEP
jgi:branched-chain amino acid transport system substrate-binding protein